jgi:FdhD protein
MARGRTAKVLTQRWRDGTAVRTPDELIVEEPLSIHLDGVLVATTMRTPGHDFELAAGWCFTEGLLGGATVRNCRYCGTGSATDTEYNVVSVDTGGAAPVPEPRLGTTSSSCGVCGTTAIDELTERLTPLVNPVAIDPAVMHAAVGRVRADQPLFAATGAVHAAAAFTPDGDVVAVREDIGRHNAVDKVVGHLLLGTAATPTGPATGPVAGRIPGEGLGLYVSGRASFEMVAKAWAAGFSAVVAVSAPSALAVQTARRAGLALAGFVRDDQMNLYAPDPAARR